MRVERVGLIIAPTTCDSIGTNINGPSLIRSPDWLENVLGHYLLYFADHKGSFIRLAFADELAGPWTVHRPGSLHLADSGFTTTPPEVTAEQRHMVIDGYTKALGPGLDMEQVLADATIPHIASPDVHVDDERGRIVMYFHGLETLGVQASRSAESRDGLAFSASGPIIGRPYLRAFEHDGRRYAMTMPGHLQRAAETGPNGWEQGPQLFDRSMRHTAVLVREGRLHVMWSRVGDAPESILHSTIEMSGDWTRWSASEPEIALQPEHPWEGADLGIEPSRRSVAHGRVNQLRDPCLFVEGDRTWLLYCVAGESGIALAEIHW